MLTSIVGSCISLTQKGPPASPLQTTWSQPPHLPTSTVGLSAEVPQKSFLTCNVLLSGPTSHTSHIPFPDQSTALRPSAHGLPSLVFWQGGVLIWSPSWDPRAGPLAQVPAWDPTLLPTQASSMLGSFQACSTGPHCKSSSPWRLPRHRCGGSKGPLPFVISKLLQFKYF